MKKYRIIVVENDEDEQFFMKEGFDASGLFEIIAQAKNGDTLFEWLEENRATLPDLILSDLNMPGMNGYDIISAITASPVYCSIPVVITSTSSVKNIMDKCLEMGAADYLVKPDSFIEYVPYAQKLHRRIEENEMVK